MTGWIAIAIFLSYVAGVACAAHALRQVRTAQGMIAWLMALLLIPFIAVPAYLVLGRSKFQGYLSSRASVEEATREVARMAREHACECVLDPDNEDPLFAGLSELARVPATRSNRVEVLINGDRAFRSLFEGIESAQDYILAMFYIIRCDGVGLKFKDALMERARAGVRVYLLYDEIGCFGLGDDYIDELRDAGVNVSAFNAVDGRRLRFQLNFRNHRKLVVVDGRSCWIGGINVGDEYLGLNPEFGEWRDTHARLDGPATLGAQLAFCMDWYWACEEDLDLDWTVHPVDGGDTEALVFPAVPAGHVEGATLMFMRVIMSARQRLWLTTPYFVPDPGIVTALQAAAVSGVDVRLIIPEVSDHPAADRAAWSYYESLMDCGVRVFFHRKGLMHQKVFLVDDELVGIGSKNFDNRSFRLNFELTLLAKGERVVRQVEEMLEKDLEDTRELRPEEVESQTTAFLMGARLCRLAAPIL